MSNSVQPHRRQPTRLSRPRDSPGKNTGVGCHFLLQCMKVKSESEVGQLCLTLSDPMDCSLPGSSGPWDFPGKSTGVGCHCLLQSLLFFFLILFYLKIVVFIRLSTIKILYPQVSNTKRSNAVSLGLGLEFTFFKTRIQW